MRQSRDVQVRQDAADFIRRSPEYSSAPFIARVIQTYSERMTCDLETVDGQLLQNVPVLTKGGLSEGKPYGEICLPMIDDYVIVIHAAYGARHKVIIGTILPYLANEMTKDVVRSDDKDYTKTLFVPDKPIDYRRVFPSGLSVQVGTSGGFVVETPSGAHFFVNEAAETITIRDKFGNIVTMDSGGTTIEDANGNEIEMGATSVTINGNLEVLQ